MPPPLALFLLLLVPLVARCTNVYESGSGTDVDCDPTTNLSRLDDGAPNPLLCERTDEGNVSNENASSSRR